MNAQDFVPLINKPDDAPEVEALLRSLKVTKKPRLPKDDLYAYVQFPGQGFVLVFQESSDPRSSKLVVSSAQIYSDAETGFTTFSGALTDGLQFTDGRTEVRKRLGKPDDTTDFTRTDTWRRSSYDLSVQYTRDKKRIQMVSLDRQTQ
jgi:hypothetical protein